MEDARRAGVAGVRVRVAEVADAHAVAEVRVAGWRAAYRGILPDRVLDRLRPDPDRRAEQIRDPNGATHLVAEADGRVTGWACVGPSRDTDAASATREIYACYVLPELWGRGIGRALVEAALDVAGPGAPVTLWVLRDNHPARGFYERLGFTPDGHERDLEHSATDPDTRAVREIRYTRPA